MNVSTATVSNAFNHPERVSPALRKRILAEAARVGYTGPDPAARQLRRGRSDVIGLIFTDELSFAFRDNAAVHFLEGLTEVCGAADRGLLLLPIGTPDHVRAISPVDAAAIDGAIAYSVAVADEHLLAASERKLPLLVVDQPEPSKLWDWVGLDDRAAGRDVGAHLRGLGHTKVGVITGRLDTSRHNGPASEDRWVNARYRVRSNRILGLVAGLEREDGGEFLPVEERFETSLESGGNALDALLARNPELTAIFCLSDAMALGALARARALGFRVPADLSIVGFDDIDGAVAAHLTTVRQPLADKGRAAGQLLIQQIDSADSSRRAVPHHRYLPTRLEVRGTTGLAASRSAG